MQKTHTLEARKHALRLSKQACNIVQLLMQYHTERIGNAIEDIDSKLLLGEQ